MTKVNSLPDLDIYSLIPNDQKSFWVYTHPVAALIVFPHFILDKINDLRTNCDGHEFLENHLSSSSLQAGKEEVFEIIHLTYESGYKWNNLDNPFDEHPIAILLKFSERSLIDIYPTTESLPIDWNIPCREIYSLAFEKGLEHLKRGDCYQYNLTFPFVGHFKNKKNFIETFISKIWGHEEKRGAFCSFTKLSDVIYYSNSPECLFDWEEEEGRSLLKSCPIKGTIEFESGEDFQKKWQELCQSEKDESELFMITDLLRNDMNKIGSSSVRVKGLKEPLVVPGLLHSYSDLEVEIGSDIRLLQIVKSLFPGGSITGAPKKRVMEIIHELENGPRGFYCGTTITREGLKIRASINIRGGEIDLKKRKIKYHSGCGITYDSCLENEFLEMVAKFKSFTGLLTSK